ncbi:MAG: fumarylacetoacetate hydrolase family protein [Bacteroidia bacterium]|nr:fumarylacetoacetate hydrolase family protein [Bacteroidia bacterium]
MKIICIGRNYPAHARELNNEIPEDPVIFLKPETAVLQSGNTFFLPTFSPEIHYECEVTLKIGKKGKDIPETQADSYLSGVGLGIDFTARDLQQKLKQKGLPWELSKAFDKSAVISEFYPIHSFQNIHELSFELFINGLQKQQGNTREMLFSIPKIISFVSMYFTLIAGDIIFTGTPAGVGKVNHGDLLAGKLNGHEILTVSIGNTLVKI